VLRLDLAGLGDSATRAGTPSNEPYPTAVMTDVAAAVAFMREHTGTEDLTLSGLCSGGYHALRAAAAGLTINRVFCVNPLIFFWEDGVTGAELRLSEAIHNTQRYRRKALSGNGLKRILTGHINMRRLYGMIANRLRMALPSTSQPSAPGETAAYKSLVKRVNSFKLGRELEQIGERGVQITFVFSRGESGLELLDMLAKESLLRLGDRCRIHQIDGADQIFSQGEPRSELMRVLSDELYNSR
jgi:pimeloyl-ACP methyl ester carboxylesterase